MRGTRSGGARLACSHADIAHNADPGASTGPVTQAEHGVAFLLKQSGGVWT
jgi:hypothetical protein